MTANNRQELLTGAREALDEAIARVTQAEYSRLSQGRGRGELHERGRACVSLNRLRRGEQPDYDDEWVALLYVIRYQPRQVNLVHSVLLRSAPRICGPVHIVDVGSGAWASMIAVAIFHSAAKNEAVEKTEIRIHGIEPSTPMTRLGEELWIEFGCAVERMGLAPIIETVDAMTDTISIFPSLDDCSSTARVRVLDRSTTSGREYWLLSVHALYEESKDDIRDFLDDYREWIPSCIRYELITSDGTKETMVRDLIIPMRGQWLGPRRDYWHELGDPVALPVWTGVLPKTTGMRSQVLDDFNVRWDSHNDVRDDAIWVRSVPR